MLFTIPEHLINTIISAVAIIVGALMGGLFSFLITRKNTLRNIKHDEFYKNKQICQNANIIRLDICTALFQSIRTLKQYNIQLQINTDSKHLDVNMQYSKEGISNKYPIPINKEYSCSVSSLSDKYSLKELSYIYQLYAIIEKLNQDILNCNFYDDTCYKIIINGYIDVLRKVYGDNYKNVINFDIDKLSYEEIYNNDFTKKGYREVLKKLDNICVRHIEENL